MNVPRRLLVAGGAGFIGSNFVRHLLATDRQVQVAVLDKLSYAGNRRNIADLEADDRCTFVQGDITDANAVDDLAAETDAIVNFAAETHVDRSIEAPDAFISTDINGTFTLLEAVRKHRHQLFLQISTDEVYGEVATGSWRESDPLTPRSPYAASKASADLLSMAYHATYGTPVIISRATNNFGPYQYPEKVIPLFVTNALDDQPLPVYGDGRQVRDWLYVEDHCAALRLLLERGQIGEIYNVATGNELSNLDVTRSILQLLDKPLSLVRHVKDRPGHDRRYSLDCTKLRTLGWRPQHAFATALAATVDWYVAHQDWWRPLKSGEYVDYYRRQYADRLAEGTILEAG